MSDVAELTERFREASLAVLMDARTAKKVDASQVASLKASIVALGHELREASQIDKKLAGELACLLPLVLAESDHTSGAAREALVSAAWDIDNTVQDFFGLWR